MVTIVKDGKDYSIVQGEKPYAKILTVDGATDTFTPITEGVWRWHRHTDAPTDSMRMEMIFLGEPTFTMVPSVSYNGNGFGDTPEYVGDRTFMARATEERKRKVRTFRQHKK